MEVTFVGNLTKPCTTQTLANGKSVTNFSVAVNQDRWDKQTQQAIKQAPVFLECSWWNAPETVAQSFIKGLRVLVTGTLKGDTWTGKDNAQHLTLRVTVQEAGLSPRFTQLTATPKGVTPSTGQGWEQGFSEPAF